MVSFRHPAAVCALLATVAVLGAACGGSSKSAPASSNSTVATADSNVGSILVDSAGETLYLFAKDSGGVSACGGACAKAWPPYAAKGAALHVGSGLKASLLKRMTRADGTKQLTYNGHPLYTFSGDSKAGDITGQGSDAFGARWYVVSPDGAAIEKAASSGSHMGY
jgi:predicted lipoprotein with Yx(FWY)xxD motif